MLSALGEIFPLTLIANNLLKNLMFAIYVVGDTPLGGDIKQAGAHERVRGLIVIDYINLK